MMIDLFIFMAALETRDAGVNQHRRAAANLYLLFLATKSFIA